MNSNSTGSNISLKPHSESFNLKNIFLEQNKYKLKNTKSIHINNRLYEHQRKKGDFNYLQKYVHKHFISLYKNSKNDYNVRMIEDILNNESTHLVAEFKDYLIMGDITEFLQKLYTINECKKYLPKIYEYYNSCSVIFPNYVNLHESKYIYKNIRKKQKVIDNQQEQEEKQEKLKKGGNINIENNEDFFTTKTFNSILDQTNTSNLKLFFGINDKIDANETPNDIVAKLEKAEKEAMKRKINLVKNNKNSRQINNIIENNTTNNIKMNDNTNNNIVNNNNKIYNKNKTIKERNKNNTNNNIHYLTGSKKKNNIKLNHNHLNSNINTNLINNPEKANKILINNYSSKNYQYFTQNTTKSKENISNNYTKTNSNIIDLGKNNVISGKNNYTTIYGNSNNNSINNIKKKEIRKFLIDNSRNKHHQIYFRNINHSNKNIKKQLINSLFPSKPIFTTLLNNHNDTNSNNNSILKHNSFNLINKKSEGKNKTETNSQIMAPQGIAISPPIITIQTNPFRNKNYNINIKIKESNSTRNIINNKLNENTKSKEKLNLKINPDKTKKIKFLNNQKIIDFNNNTITNLNTTKAGANKEKIKYIHKNKNFIYNKAQMNDNNLHQNRNYNNFKNYRTIGNTSPYKKNLNNENRNITIKNNSIKNINNINNTNNYMINNLNIHKINSTSNIQKPMNMNININMNNSNKNKIYFNNGSCTNIVQKKIYSKSPLSIELETIKVTKKKRTIYPKNKLFSDITNNNHNKQNIYTNYNSNIPNTNTPSNTILNDRNYYFDSINHNSLNSNNFNEELINSGFSTSSNKNYINNAKNNFFLDELYKKKNIILPLNKEINNINININGYPPSGTSMTSRISNNVSKKKYKKNTNIQEIYLYNMENKAYNKAKMNNKKNNNNLLSRNEGNPVKIKKIYDSLQTKKMFVKNNKNSGYSSARKNKQ